MCPLCHQWCVGGPGADVFFVFLLAMRKGIEYCKPQDSMVDQMENEQRAEMEAEMKIMHPNVKVGIEVKLILRKSMYY